MGRAWVVLVAGGHAAGKSRVSNDVSEGLHKCGKHFSFTVQDLDMKTYRKDQECDDQAKAISRTVFLGPENMDFVALETHLDSLERDAVSLSSDTIIIVHGLYALYSQSLRDRAIMKVFVDCDADTRLSRWILRDVKERGRELATVLDEYLTAGRTEMNEFVLPTKQYADVILPRGSETEAVDLVSIGIYDRIREEPHHRLHVQAQAQTPILRSTQAWSQLASTFKTIDFSQEEFKEQNDRFYEPL